MATTYNGTLPLSEMWAGYLTQAKSQLPATLDTRIVLIAMTSLPIVAIVLNVLAQLVRLHVVEILGKSNMLLAHPKTRHGSTCCLPLASLHWLSHCIWNRSPQLFLGVP